MVCHFCKVNEDFGPLSIRAAVSNRPVPWQLLLTPLFLLSDDDLSCI